MSATYIPVKAEEWAKMVEATKLAADLLVENKRLKDENEQLREAWVDKKMQEHRDYLAAENERLRKAGDAMRDCVDSDTFPNIIAAWNAAKEGRDAK